MLIADYCRVSFWQMVEGQITLAELERRMDALIAKQPRLKGMEVKK